MSSFCISAYNLKNGKRISPRNFVELKDEIVRLQRAKNKLLKLGYKLGGGIGYQERNEISLHSLCQECGELKQDYAIKKKWKEVIEPIAYKTARKRFKDVRRYGKNAGDAASRIITFCIKQCGKRNIKAMQTATPETLTIRELNSATGWSKRYISWNYDNEKTLFNRRFNSIMDGEYENGVPLRSSTDVPIPDDIACEVIECWENKHYLERKQLLHVDIWNREKKFDPVRTELLLKLAPNSTLTLCWAIPICVLEKSLVRKRRQEVREEAMTFYHEAQKKAHKHWEDESKVRDAIAVYWYQKEHFSIDWKGHPFGIVIRDILLGSRPNDFKKMMRCYKQHVEYMYREREDDPYWNQSDRSYELERWQRWEKKLASDLKIFLEALQKRDVHSFDDSPFNGCKLLKGCSRDIMLKRVDSYLGYGAEEIPEEEYEEEEKWLQEMREEEIERLEELAERMRDYGSD